MPLPIPSNSSFVLNMGTFMPWGYLTPFHLLSIPQVKEALSHISCIGMKVAFSSLSQHYSTTTRTPFITHCLEGEIFYGYYQRCVRGVLERVDVPTLLCHQPVSSTPFLSQPLLFPLALLEFLSDPQLSFSYTSYFGPQLLQRHFSTREECKP